MTDSSAPEGWYPDRGRFRWWDGTQWIDRYLDEERHHDSDDRGTAPSETVAGLVICGEVAVLGITQLLWLGRAKEALGLAFIGIGPMIGVIVGTRLSARRQRARKAKAHSLLSHIVVLGAMVLGFVVFITSINGGLGRNAVVPTVVLTLLGTTSLVLTSKTFYPESFSTNLLTEESS